MTIRKFFDTAAVDTGGGVNVANLMATHGKMNAEEVPVVTLGNSDTEQKQTQTEGSGTPVATTNDQQTNVEAKPETQTQTTEQVVTQAPEKAVTETKAPSLQEVLRQHQPDSVLKELGFDDSMVGFVKDLKELDPKMVAFLNTWKSGGNVEGYLKELTTDYSKMPAEEVMRHQLRQEYPKASDKALDALFKREVLAKYNLDSVDEMEAEEGRLLLEATADRYRDDFVKKQQDFLLPKPPEAKAAVVDDTAIRQQQEVEAYKAKITGSEYTKGILATRQISVGEGDEKFNFPVDPQELVDTLIDGEKWAANLYNEDGSPKLEHQYLVAAVAKYGTKFLKEYANHFKSLGGKTVVETLDNAKPAGEQTQTTTQYAPKNPAEAMARQGIFNSGGR